MFLALSTLADGCFVFRWNKQKDINEPTQKAIILHDQNREDLILQVKYEGPAEDFGWLIPVPGQPEVRKGDMQPFYELSKLTQKHFRENRFNAYLGASKGMEAEGEVKVIEIKTVGAYEVAILLSTNPSALADWLATNHFGFPKEKQSVLDRYIERHWFFVAARINPQGNGFATKPGEIHSGRVAPATRQKLASGELHPIIISFPSEKCIFPLAISAVNGAPSEISLYVISAQPLLNSVIFDRKLKVYQAENEKPRLNRAEMRKRTAENRARVFRDSPLSRQMNAEDPNDPPPSDVFDSVKLGAPETEFYADFEEDFYSAELQLVRSMSLEGNADDLRACRHDLPRLKGKQWWLTKLVETFPPEDMVDLEFESALPFLAERLRHDNGEAAAHCLPQYEKLAIPTLLQALTDSEAAVRRRALPAAQELRDPSLVDPLVALLQDKDPKCRARACYSTQNNWSPRFETALLPLLQDPEPGVAHAASYTLRQHRGDTALDSATLRKLLADDGPASLFALEVLQTRGELPENELKHFFTSTNLPVLSSAFSPLRHKLKPEDVTPLMTNSLPMARMMALGVLAQIADRPAVDGMVSMLHDPNELIRWRVRSDLRRVTGQKLGADPAAYEKWWAENRDTYVPTTRQRRS